MGAWPCHDGVAPAASSRPVPIPKNRPRSQPAKAHDFNRRVGATHARPNRSPPVTSHMKAQTRIEASDMAPYPGHCACHAISLRGSVESGIAPEPVRPSETQGSARPPGGRGNEKSLALYGDNSSNGFPRATSQKRPPEGAVGHCPAVLRTLIPGKKSPANGSAVTPPPRPKRKRRTVWTETQGPSRR